MAKTGWVWDGTQFVALTAPVGAFPNAVGNYSATAPENPKTGQMWFDTTTNSLKIWSGSIWTQSGVDLSDYLTISSASTTYATSQSVSTTYAPKISPSFTGTANAENLNFSGSLFRSSVKTTQVFELSTPAIYEMSWTGSIQSSFTVSQIPTDANYMLCDIFLTANSSDHQNFEFGRSNSQQKNWVDTRGVQPSTQFGSLARHTVICTYNGEADGYSPNYGLWFSNQMVPSVGRVVYYHNFGNSGSNGWIYIRVRGYAI